MSRDMTSEEWAEAIVRPRRLDLDDLERRVGYVRQRAYYEGLTAHLRATFVECPFCSGEEPNIAVHLITCEEVPPELRGG